MSSEKLGGVSDGMVYALYDGLLGRAPDDAGLNYWTSRLHGGDSVRDVAEAMLNSPEKQAQLGGLDDNTFVERLYEYTLHRHGDDDGVKYWDDQLGHGESRVDVALGFVLSHEHVSHVFDADIAGLYSGLLNRAPDVEGLHYFRDALEHGTSLDDIAQAFLSSPEFQAKSAGLNSADYVEDLYEHVLGRHGDDGGLHHWEDMLEHGASRGAVAVAIAHSPEAHEHLAPNLDGLWHL